MDSVKTGRVSVSLVGMVVTALSRDVPTVAVHMDSARSTPMALGSVDVMMVGMALTAVSPWSKVAVIAGTTIKVNINSF